MSTAALAWAKTQKLRRGPKDRGLPVRRLVFDCLADHASSGQCWVVGLRLVDIGDQTELSERQIRGALGELIHDGRVRQVSRPMSGPESCQPTIYQILAPTANSAAEPPLQAPRRKRQEPVVSPATPASRPTLAEQLLIAEQMLIGRAPPVPVHEIPAIALAASVCPECNLPISKIGDGHYINGTLGKGCRFVGLNIKEVSARLVSV